RPSCGVGSLNQGSTACVVGRRVAPAGSLAAPPTAATRNHAGQAPLQHIRSSAAFGIDVIVGVKENLRSNWNADASQITSGPATSSLPLSSSLTDRYPSSRRSRIITGHVSLGQHLCSLVDCATK